MYRIALSLIALAFCQSALAAKSYDEHIDEFNGAIRYESKAIFSVGGGKITSQIFGSNSSNARVYKIYFGADVDMEVLRAQAVELQIDNPENGLFVIEIEVVADAKNSIGMDDNLGVRIDGKFSSFPPIETDYSAISAGYGGQTIKGHNIARYYVPQSLLSSMLGAKDVMIKASGSNQYATMELDKKGRKRLGDFLRDVP